MLKNSYLYFNKPASNERNFSKEQAMPVNHRAGTYVISSVAGEEYRAFIPRPLPPDPPLSLSVDDYDLMEKANRALGRLDGLATLLPDTSLFLYFFVGASGFSVGTSPRSLLASRITLPCERELPSGIWPDF